jgi:hypothetical protein
MDEQRFSIPFSDFTWKLLNYITQNRDGVIFASEEAIEKRIETCRSCEKFVEKDNRCNECGCLVEGGKSTIIFERCPLNKWGPDRESWDKKMPMIQERINDELSMEYGSLDFDPNSM